MAREEKIDFSESQPSSQHALSPHSTFNIGFQKFFSPKKWHKSKHIGKVGLFSIGFISCYVILDFLDDFDYKKSKNIMQIARMR